MVQTPQEEQKRLRVARNLRLPQDLTRAVHHADARLFQRHVDADILFHGCLPLLAWGRLCGPRSHFIDATDLAIGRGPPITAPEDEKEVLVDVTYASDVDTLSPTRQLRKNRPLAPPYRRFSTFSEACWTRSLDWLPLLLGA